MTDVCILRHISSSTTFAWLPSRCFEQRGCPAQRRRGPGTAPQDARICPRLGCFKFPSPRSTALKGEEVLQNLGGKLPIPRQSHQSSRSSRKASWHRWSPCSRARRSALRAFWSSCTSELSTCGAQMLVLDDFCTSPSVLLFGMFSVGWKFRICDFSSTGQSNGDSNPRKHKAGGDFSLCFSFAFVTPKKC